MANKKIIELDAASQVNSDALFAVSQQVSGSQKTVKGTVGQVGEYIGGTQTFSGLNTTSKNLVGAINEVVQGGGSGGHTILDNEGDALTQRDNLQFVGAYSEDASTKTVVNVVRSMTQAQFNQLSSDEKVGLINVTDATLPLAEEIDYDNTTSGLSADNIQDAVDELASEKADKSAISDLITLSGKSGSIASFSTDIADKLFSCYVNVTAVQAGSGTPAPDNVRSISGWSACNLSAIGANLAKLTPRAQESANGIISTIYDDNRIVENGTSSGNGDVGIDFTNELKLDSDKSYTISLTGTDTRSATLNIFFHYKNGAYTSPIGMPNSAHKLTFTNIGGIFDRILLRTSNTFTISLDAKLQIEVGTSQSTYESYNGTTHNIPFNTTVYGGVLDVLSGVLTVTHGYVDLGAWDWAYEDLGVVRMTTAQSTLKLRGNGICNMYIGGAENTDGGIWVSNSQAIPLIRIKDTAHFTSSSTPTDIKTFLTGGQAVFELYQPTTIQLTPTEVKTILGQNNIFADTGDIDLKYLETIGNRL